MIDFAAAETAEAMVRLDEGPHEYFLDDRRVPGCTEALEDVAITDYSMVDSLVLKRAADLGTWVHAARHLDDDGDLDESGPCPDKGLGHLDGWRRFRAEMRVEVLLSEQLLYIPSGNPLCMPVGGRLDVIALVSSPTRRPARLVIIDLKTGTTFQDGVGAQTAGYALMCRALNICDPAERWCVQTFADGKYRVWPQEQATDEIAFRSAVWLWWWKRGGTG